MRNNIKISVSVCVFIFALDVCVAQTSTDSTSGKKSVLQKKSKVFARIELGALAGFEPVSDFSEPGPKAFMPGVFYSATVGYSISKNIRMGLGSAFLFSEYKYLPVFASLEFGNHTKELNGSFILNGGYAFIIDNHNISLLDEPGNGFLVEFLPTVSFGSYITKSRFHVSLGNQFLSYSYYSPSSLLFVDQSSPNNRVESPGINKKTKIRMNEVLKFGVDF